MTTHAGGCRCGAIRFEAKAEPIHISYCHCGDCRRASGAPVSAFVGFRADDVAFSGEAASTYGAAPITRSFCGRCGSPIAYADDRLAGQIYMMLGAMDAPEHYPPRVHGYVREQLAFFHIDDGLPRMETITVPRSQGAQL
ncbi:GFA family protein [Metarhizobium album]|uniref:GFA family protein n=1 Tax=Metarhizobium album TaxID=2182425 RepID=A0A2U2DS17_9HYPH|nr:GFA family protein [Rhizobium album]PWE56115.1 GFA family protein [Rhizobium album]